ncbi:hypothetical protein [Atribacter laminatus]|jgi:hypothetical protein|uniref:Uncharacterized protein n=1 Tax=Atribacter laminatus TaxID=2847778 RepID=A0A7T1AMF5_ATRLM|nr:hypothetical protein [Atribacter laminatus]QPM68548.1 hypothetical protein RT761_01769 [Atribacter laminatus]
MKTFFLVVLFIVTITTISFGFENLELYHHLYKSDTLYLKNQYFVQKSSKFLIGGLNFHTFFENIIGGNFYQRFRIYLLTLSLILVGVFFGVFYSRMTQPPIKK